MAFPAENAQGIPEHRDAAPQSPKREQLSWF